MPHYTKLPGTWTKQGSQFVSNHDKGFTLLLVERHKPKPKQPKKYILAILPSGQREYVSGILDDGKIDYNGYQFEFIQDKTNEFTIV